MRFPISLVAAVFLVGLAACVPAENVPSNCGEPSVSLTATLKADGMTPRTLDVCRDQQVSIVIASEAAGELHFHGYEDAVDVQAVAPGQSLIVQFSATHPGQFPIELHPEDGSDEVEVAALVVHDR